MHVPINVKSPNNISKWQMGFKGLWCYGDEGKLLTVRGLSEDSQSSSGMIVCILEKVSFGGVLDLNIVGIPFHLM